jgi:arylsulfatase A-like enzyme
VNALRATRFFKKTSGGGTYRHERVMAGAVLALAARIGIIEACYQHGGSQSMTECDNLRQVITQRACRFAVLAACIIGGGKLPGCSKPDSSGSGGGAARVTPSADLKQHNVLLVTLDTTRVDYVSCYNPSRADLTPNIDAVAKDGVRFDFAIAQSAGTPMSHASILTGLYPYQHGVRVISAAGGYWLQPEIPTLTTELQRHGWQTAAFLSAFTVSEYYGFDHGFDTFDNGLEQDAGTIVEDVEDGHRRWDQRKHQRRSDKTIDEALAWLPGAASPFFMWVHLWDPHDRMVMPPMNVVQRFVPPGTTEADDAFKRAVYEAEVHYMDAQLGRLLDALRASGAYDNTIIAIVGDHGQGLGQHDWWSHRLLYQEDLHIPLIVRMPGWPAGKNVPELVRTIDIFPTVLETIGIATSDKIPGISLHGLVAGEPETPRIAYADQINKYDMVSRMIAARRPKDDLLYSVIDGPWKLIYRPTRPHDSELFNLADDPLELKNVHAEHPDQVQRLKAILDEHDGYVSAPFTGGTSPSRETLARLAALGYVGTVEEDDPNDEAPDAQPPTQPASQPASDATSRPAREEE